MANILVFGTSTTYGCWDSEGGWVSRLRKFIDQKIIDSNYQIDYLIYNLGISGDKSHNILERFDSETEPRLDRYDRENIFLLHFGINDCIYNEAQGGLEVPPEKFRKNYLKTIEKAKKYSSKIVIIGSMPVDSRVDPMPWVPGRAYKNENVAQYNKIMEEVADETRVHFIEVFKKCASDNPSELLADGVHMNDKGHEKLFLIVKEYLLREKIISLT